MLKGAVDAWQNRFRHSYNFLGSSPGPRSTMASSAYTLTSTLFKSVLILKPFSGGVPMLSIRGSISRVYRRYDVGSPY